MKHAVIFIGREVNGMADLRGTKHKTTSPITTSAVRLAPRCSISPMIATAKL